MKDCELHDRQNLDGKPTADLCFVHMYENKARKVQNRADTFPSTGGKECNLRFRQFFSPYRTEAVFVDLLRRLGIYSQPGEPARQPYFSYRPARLYRLVKTIPRNRFLSSINVYKYGLSFEPLNINL
jgi:hypothetical protein